jgi:hypothetical protein
LLESGIRIASMQLILPVILIVIWLELHKISRLLL